MPRNTIAVTCLAREASIARGTGVSVVCSKSAGLAAALTAAIVPGVSGIISFGIAGGLDPALAAGDWVVASAVRSGERSYTTDHRWTQELLRRLPNATLAEIVGTDAMILHPSDKASLYEKTTAVAADMESHIAAEFAAARGIPFASCRVIIDSARRRLPPATALALRSNGSVNVPAVMRSVLEIPGQVPDLLRIAFDAFIAERALRQGRQQLSHGLGSPYPHDFPAERVAGQSGVADDFLQPLPQVCETP
ncbi:MAG TPA: adenosylhopane nucleosidase [Pseudolabrys sp.]|jgi:hopanoid-associated phosphorylase